MQVSARSIDRMPKGIIIAAKLRHTIARIIFPNLRYCSYDTPGSRRVGFLARFSGKNLSPASYLMDLFFASAAFWAAKACFAMG